MGHYIALVLSTCYMLIPKTISSIILLRLWDGYAVTFMLQRKGQRQREVYLHRCHTQHRAHVGMTLMPEAVSFGAYFLAWQGGKSQGEKAEFSLDLLCQPSVCACRQVTSRLRLSLTAGLAHGAMDQPHTPGLGSG